MPVPNSMQDLAQLAGSNSPAGTEAIGNSLDNYLRAHGAIIRSTNAIASASIASASTTDIGTADGESVLITGTTTITSLGTGFVGCYRECRFSGALILTHSANLQLPNSTNITTAVGDAIAFRCIGSGVWAMVGKSKTILADVVGGLGYTPANKAGDTFTGNVNIDFAGAAFHARDSTALAAGNGGLFGMWSLNNSAALVELARVKGHLTDGTVGGEAGEMRFYTKTGGALALGMTLDALKNLIVQGAIVPGGTGRKISKVTVSSSAPGALADGELYLRY